MWTAVVLGSIGCYLFKLVGLSVPEDVLERPRVHQVARLLPLALLAALTATQTLTGDARVVVVDARAGALLVAAVAVLVRAPFLVVVAVAVVTAALLRAVS